MPWVRAVLRGQRVFARATESGDLLESSGKVEIRYKPNDGRRYEALARNLEVEKGEVLPDETCGDAERPAAKSKEDEAAAKSPGAKSGAGGAKRSFGSRASSTPSETVKLEADDLVAYTDGACTGNPGPAGLGVVLVVEGAATELSEYLGHATNNIAELSAILRAVELVKGKTGRLVVHTDSQYSIGVLSKGWKAKANAELIANIRVALKERPGTKLVYVKGHAGVPLNERADELARAAIVTRKTVRQEGRVLT